MYKLKVLCHHILCNLNIFIYFNLYMQILCFFAATNLTRTKSKQIESKMREKFQEQISIFNFFQIFDKSVRPNTEFELRVSVALKSIGSNGLYSIISQHISIAIKKYFIPVDTYLLDCGH